MAQIKDVARLARVSTATVSRVVNGKHVDPVLEARVRDAVAELSYSPNRQARSLRRQQSQVVALILPDIENPFYTALTRGVEDVAQEAGFSVVLCNTDEKAEKESVYLAIAESEYMAGVIIAATSAHPEMDGLIRNGSAVVAIDRKIDFDVSQVAFDNRGLGRLATQELIDRGFERIACISGPLQTSTAVDRAEGWLEAMQEAGLETGGLLRHSNYRVDGGRAAARELLSGPFTPDALVTTNNLVGVGAMQVFTELGLSERGLAVIGDVPFATSKHEYAFLIPLNPREMGNEAARMLLRRIQSPNDSGEHLVLQLPQPRALTW